MNVGMPATRTSEGLSGPVSGITAIRVALGDRPVFVVDQVLGLALPCVRSTGFNRLGCREAVPNPRSSFATSRRHEPCGRTLPPSHAPFARGTDGEVPANGRHQSRDAVPGGAPPQTAGRSGAPSPEFKGSVPCAAQRFVRPRRVSARPWGTERSSVPGSYRLGGLSNQPAALTGDVFGNEHCSELSGFVGANLPGRRRGAQTLDESPGLTGSSPESPRPCVRQRQPEPPPSPARAP